MLLEALVSSEKGKRDKSALSKKFREAYKPTDPMHAASNTKEDAKKKGSVATK